MLRLIKYVLLIKFVLIVNLLFSQTTDFFIKVKNNEGIDISFNREDFSSKSHILDKFIEKYEVAIIDKPFKTKDENIENTFLINLKNPQKLENIKRALSKFSFIEYIEEVPQHELFFTPNDPLYAQQWYLPHINAEQAWDISTGSNNIVIAIVDDAVRLDHEDLQGAIFQNTNETLNGQDDDGNGYIDDINGWDAADNNNNPNPPLWNVSNTNFTHGTHVAGIAAASTNNSIGMASIGFGIKILPVKIKLDATSGPGLQAAIQGVDYAIASGYSNVVNMSFGGASYSQTFQNLITAGHNQGIVFVAAAGNNNTIAPMYPASYNHVISIAATTPSNQKASFSNFGPTIDVSAPGVNILSSMATGVSAYSNMQGTSMASPLVAGLCGLMLSHAPNSTPQEIEDCLKSTATDINGQNPQYSNLLGAGVVNAQAALSCLVSEPLASFSSDIQTGCSGEQIQFFDESSGVPTNWLWEFPGGVPATSNQQNPILSYPTNGVYTISLEVSNAIGSNSITQTNYITIESPTATLSGSTSIPAGGAAFLQVTFTGNAPYNIEISDGSNNIPINNITQNPFYYQVNPSENTVYELINFETNSGCVGDVSGNANISIANLVDNEPCTDYFKNVLNTEGETERLNIAPTPDGGYVLSGTTTNAGQGLKDLFVQKFDVNDVLIWSKTYGTADEDYGFSNPIVVLNDGSIIVATSSKNYNTYSNRGIVVYLKLDGNGNIIWQKRFDTEGFQYNLSRTIIAEEDYFIISGSDNQTLPSFADNAYAKKFDLDGNLIWSTTYEHDNHAHSTSITKLNSNDGYIYGGNIDGIGNNRSLPIYKIDNDGVFEWAKSYDFGNKTEWATDIINTLDGNLLIYGFNGNQNPNSSSELILMKVNYSGDIIYSKLINQGNTTNTSNTVKELSNGDIIFSGVTNAFGNGSFNLFVSRFSINGDEIWTKVFGGENDELSFSQKDKNLLVNESQNYGLVLGSTESFGGADKDILLVKFSLEDDTLCSELSGQLWNVTNSTPIEFNITPVSTGPLCNVVDANFTEGVLPVESEDNICNIECDESINDACNYVNEFTADDNIEMYYSDYHNGFTYSCGKKLTGSNQQAFLTKTNESGDLIWAKTFDGVDEFRSLYIHNNHIFIISNTNSFNRDLVIYKTDLDGNEIWSQKYDAGGRDIIFLLKSGNFYYDDISNSYKLTYWRSPSPSSLIDDLGLLEIDGTNGNAISNRIFHLSGDDEIYHVIKDKFSNNLIFSGAVGSGGESGSHIARFSHGTINLSNNSVSVFERLDVNASAWPYAYVASSQFSDQSRVIMGCWKFSGSNNTSYPFIFRLDNSGNIIWSKRIDFLLPNTQAITTFKRASELYIDNEDNIIIKFYVDVNNSTDNDIMLIKYDINGNYIKSVLIENSEKGNIKFINNSSKDFIYTGYKTFNNSFTLQIFNSDLDACNFIDTVLTDFSESWQQTTNTYNDISLNTTINSINNNINDEVLTDSTICQADCDTIIDILCQNNFYELNKCNYDSIELNADLGSDYLWSPNAFISDINIQNPIIWPSENTTYIVSFTDTAECFRVDTFQINVQNTAVQISNNDTTICPPANISLNATGAQFYEWQPAVSLNNHLTQNPTFIGNQSEQIIVRGFDTVGCESFDTMQINILPCCGAFLDIEVEEDFVCVGNSIGFINNSITGNNTTINWDFGTGANPSSFVGSNPPDVQFNNVGVNVITIILDDDCGNDTLELNLSVLDLPNVIVANDTSVCSFGDFVYELGDDYVWDYEYEWTPINGLDDPVFSNPIATINQPISYNLKVTDIFGCEYFDTVNIDIIAIEDSVIGISSQQFCLEDSIYVFYNASTSYDSLFWNNSPDLNTDSLGFIIQDDTLIFITIFIDDCVFNDSISINSYDKPQLLVSSDTTVCEGDLVLLNSSSNYPILWNGLDLGNSISYNANKDSTFIISSINNDCIVFDTINIFATNYPLLNISPNEISGFQGDIVSISIVSDFDWTWTPEDGLSCLDCINPEITIADSMIYVIQSENNGCFSYDTLIVTLDIEKTCLKVPDAFSPNNDNINDFFYPLSNQSFTIFDFRIYNRWGELIHRNNEPWDGTYKREDQPLGVYIYYLEYECDGTKIKKVGNVSLIR